MDRSQKKALVENLNASLGQASSLVVAHYKGLTVAEMTELRGRVRKAGASFKVTKNKLTKRALEGTQFAEIAGMFVGPTALAYSSDPIAAAKVLVEYAKQNEKLVVVGGAFGERSLDSAEVEALAKMPSLDELRSRIIGLLQAPATKVACVLQAPGGQVARVIGAYSRKE